MSFDDFLRPLMYKLQKRYPKCTNGIEKAAKDFREQYTAGKFEGWDSTDIGEAFIDAVNGNCQKRKPYRSGKRGGEKRGSK